MVAFELVKNRYSYHTSNFGTEHIRNM